MAEATDAAREKLLRDLRFVGELKRHRLKLYEPYPKQRAFHEAGREHRERALLAANQSGKTWAAALEVAIHATGEYPSWWKGRVFRGATRWWAASTSSDTTRDNPQRMLLGTEDQGTGAIPASALLDVKRSRGVAGGVDRVLVRHAAGGTSSITFKSYEQSRESWQGETLHGVWYDEEPPLDVYLEGLTRTNATGGITLLTATPLLGMTDVVMRFYPRPRVPSASLTKMTLEDAGHYTDEERARIVASYPDYEREARTKGVPMLGSGRIFPVPEAAIRVEPFAIPSAWAQIGGLDFGGGDHPTAAVALAWDRQMDVVYLTREAKQEKATPVTFSRTLRSWGPRLRFAWPKDGLQHDRSSMTPLAQLYRAEGVVMLREHATFQGGGDGLEAGVAEMLDRMRTDRFKVFSTCGEWFEEYRIYHRRNGKIVKKRDDLLSASRYGLMSLRFATSAAPQPPPTHAVDPQRYDPLRRPTPDAMTARTDPFAQTGRTQPWRGR